MKFLFDWDLNLAMLERVLREKLVRTLESIQSENENEIEVTVVFFPRQFVVKVDSDELLVCWDYEKSIYKVMRKEDAIYVLNKKTRLVSVMSIREFERRKK